jgi:hypothetical protein
MLQIGMAKIFSKKNLLLDSGGGATYALFG